MDGEAGRHRVHAHVCRCRLDRRAPRECHYSCLRRCVVRLALLGAPAEHGRVVHDDAEAARQHVLQRGARAAERAVQCHIEHTRPLVVGHVDEVGRAAEAGVVDDHVEAAGRLDRGLEHRVHLALVGDVAHCGGRPRAHDVLELLGRFAETPFVLIAQHDDRALLGAALGGREPDPGAGGRRHEHGLAVEERVAGRGRRRRRGHAVTFGSGGRPRARSPITLRWIWSEPP